MIATLTGTISETVGDTTILDVDGVGYGVLLAVEDFGRLQRGQRAKLYIYEHIREQSHDLFGFSSLDTKQLFEQLLGVNGVGPKMALNVLSVGTASEVRTAIAGGDTKFIQRASGVGKRVAERIVVELKDKVGLEGVELNATNLLYGTQASNGDEAAQALIALGYSPQDATAALAQVPVDLPLEARIKQALQGAQR